jgi:hypothetical protein
MGISKEQEHSMHTESLTPCPVCNEQKERTKKLTSALVDMVNQFAYDDNESYYCLSIDEYGLTKIHTGGLSALEDAFEVLELDDPCLRKDLWEKDTVNKKEGE